MTYTRLILRNLTRHPLRALLTTLSIALSIFLVCAVLPSHLFSANPDSLVWYQLEPHAIDRFTLRIHVLVPPEHLHDERAAMLREFVDGVHHEDIAMCSAVQRGVQARLAARGPLSHLERAIAQLHVWLDARLAP